MADTVITPATDSGGAAGWAVAVIILLAVILVGIFVWPGISRTTPSGTGDASTPDAIDVNVRLPQVPVGDAPSGASGSGDVQAAPTQ
ncbi:MAG: hypothetical protein WAZ27_03195 [Minisyncoccia bacterium]